MTTLRSTLRRLFGQSASPDTDGEPQRVEFSYRVFWLKHARVWSDESRRAISQRLRALIISDDFQANVFERRYRIEGIDGEHSGASLLALIDVLEALHAAA